MKDYAFRAGHWDRYIEQHGPWGIPTIRKQSVRVRDIIGFNYAKTTPAHDAWVHFFLDDYQFERVWQRPSDYLSTLRKFAGAFSPDFSTYRDTALALQVYNVFRNRWLGSYWQDQGLSVIPTVGWSTEASFDFAFLGVEKGSTVAVSTVGVRDDKEAVRLFGLGYAEMLRVIEPATVICYGTPFPGMECVAFPTYTRKKGWD